MILRLLLYIACILPYSAFCQTHGIGQSPPSSSAGRALPVQHNPTGNFTRLRTYTSADGRQYRDEYVVYDGLGRPSGIVKPRFGPSGMGTATHTDYNAAGLSEREWLPVVFDGEAHTAADLSQCRTDTYPNDGHPVTTTAYEESPLGRVASRTGPGDDWHANGKSVHCSYPSNTATGDTRCCYYHAESQGERTTVVRSGVFATGALKGIKTTDEDGRTYIVFSDAAGRTVLRRKIVEDGYADTYYVYNDMGLLAAVLPPAASAAMNFDGTWDTDDDILRQYAYIYEYDDGLRCVGRRLPGCDWTRYVYDLYDHPVLWQDGNDRARGKWAFALTDMFGRKAMTGVCTGYSDNVATEDAFVRRTDSGGTMGYGLVDLQPSGAEPSEVCYYDSHSFLTLPCFGGIATSALVYEQADGFGSRRENAKGELTGRAEAVWDGDTKIIGYRLSAFYYDDCRRMVQSCTASPDGSTERTSLAYDFEGHVTKSLHSHTTATGATSEETDAYTYDNQGRLLTHTHGIDGGNPVLLARNTYDELGRLATTERGRNDRLTTRMEYDIRSNPTKIGGTLFTETIYYNRAHERSTPQYGGNISAIDWETYNDGTTRPLFHTYNFTYDALSRLTAAEYLKNGRYRTNAYGTRYTYDIMGNALSVRRNGMLDDGTYGTVDDLTLGYDGNHLVKVTDTAEGPYRKDMMHYTDGADEQEEFAYDANGNMTRNLDRHICSIRYNSLNLPRRIEFVDGSIVRYTYTATGDKLRADYYINPLAASASAGADAPRVDSTSLVHTWRTYAGNSVYDNDSLRMVLVDGGYITFGGGAPRYHFYLRDHLGNNRVVADIDGNIEEINHYYPYGALMDISTAATQPYKYVGKELDRNHGLDWYDHGARMNDPLTLRWNGVDNRTEEYAPLSPYSVCADNPIHNIDIDGEKIITVVFSDGSVSPKCFYLSPKHFSNAMRIFSQTSFGRKFISDFTPKGKYMFGVKGNGKYSDINVVIQENEYSSNGNNGPDFAILGSSNMIQAQTQMGEDVGGKPLFTVIFDLSHNTKELVETIVHEFTLHLSKYSDVIKAYEKNKKYKDAYNVWNREEYEHHDLVNGSKLEGSKNYNKTRHEILSKYPNLKSIFTKRQKEYEENY